MVPSYEQLTLASNLIRAGGTPGLGAFGRDALNGDDPVRVLIAAGARCIRSLRSDMSLGRLLRTAS